jgi:hypothetical protein
MPTSFTEDGYRYSLLILLRLKFFYRGCGVLLLNSFIENRADTFVNVDKDVFKNVDGIKI